MSTQTNTYAIIGAKLPFEATQDRYDELEPYYDSAFDGIHHHDGLCILDDGMNGEYAIAGRVIAKSDEYGLLESPVTFSPLNGAEFVDLKNKLEALFPKYPIELRAIVLTHYR